MMFIAGASARIRVREVKQLAPTRNKFRMNSEISRNAKKMGLIISAFCKHGVYVRVNEGLSSEKFD